MIYYILVACCEFGPGKNMYKKPDYGPNLSVDIVPSSFADSFCYRRINFITIFYNYNMLELYLPALTLDPIKIMQTALALNPAEVREDQGIRVKISSIFSNCSMYLSYLTSMTLLDCQKDSIDKWPHPSV